MESIIYDDSPLAEYLEGDAASPEDDQNDEHSLPTAPQYAPQGLPRIRERLRSISRKATAVTDLSGDRFLERFRYSIIASQLLSDDTQTSRPQPTHDEDEGIVAIPFSLRGAVIAASCSFVFAWTLHYMRQRRKTLVGTSWPEILLYVLLGICSVVVLGLLGRRQYLKTIRRRAAAATSSLLAEAQRLDTAAGRALRFIQEIEVVARGYDMQVDILPPFYSHLTPSRSYPLPPISRLDDKQGARQCRELRHMLAKSLSNSIAQYIHFHNDIQPLLDSDDLKSYYHIYELSPEDFSGAVGFVNELSDDAQESLKQLRFLLQLHSVARKFFLIDLLALRANPNWSDVHRWRRVLQIGQLLTAENASAAQGLEIELRPEEEPTQGANGVLQDGNTVMSPQDATFTPERQQSKAQIRRFETVANAARSLSARIRIARDDMTDLIANDAGEAVISATVARHYDSLGSEIKNLLGDWERGRNTMLLNVDPDLRSSRPSSGIRSPISPSPSLGGVTAVEGGPADALRALLGEDDPTTGSEDCDEQVFEALAKPRKRLSLAFSREEKIAKLQQDRAKRATLQEQADTTTSMLRELQMVIKHRPQHRQSMRITSA